MSYKDGAGGRRGGIPVFPILLIAIGVVILLNTFGVLPWWIWADLWRFWPVVLILIGVSLLLRRSSPVIMSVILIAVIASVIGLSWAISDGRVLAEDLVTTRFDAPGEGISQAHVDISFGAGEFRLDSIGNPAYLVVATFEDAEDGVQSVFEQEGSTGRVTIEPYDRDGPRWFNFGRSRREWEVLITTGPDITLELDGGAGSFTIDMEELNVTTFNIDIGAADMDLTVPASAGTVTGSIDGGAARITVTIPEGVAARISNDSGASSVDIDGDRFPKDGDVHMSPDYATATNRVDLQISSGASSITVR